MNTRKPITCVNCGYVWIPKVEVPKYCARCHNTYDTVVKHRIRTGVTTSRWCIVCVSDLTCERLMRRREPYDEPIASVIQRLLVSSNCDAVYNYRQSHKKRASKADIRLNVPCTLRNALREKSKETHVKYDELIWRLIENENR